RRAPHRGPLEPLSQQPGGDVLHGDVGWRGLPVRLDQEQALAAVGEVGRTHAGARQRQLAPVEADPLELGPPLEPVAEGLQEGAHALDGHRREPHLELHLRPSHTRSNRSSTTGVASSTVPPYDAKKRMWASRQYASDRSPSPSVQANSSSTSPNARTTTAVTRMTH